LYYVINEIPSCYYLFHVDCPLHCLEHGRGDNFRALYPFTYDFFFNL
jgi:hypothetical protein